MPIRLLTFLALCLFGLHALAGNGPGAVRKHVESSMLVTGTVDITPAGDVTGYTLDQPEKLPKGLIDMAARIVPAWKFEPVRLQGKTGSRSKMSLLFIAKKLEQDKFSVELHSASFYSGAEGDSVAVDHANSRLPTYPMALLRDGVSGTVFLHLMIGRDGKVMNIDVSHVNLRVIGSSGDMARWRRALTKASITAVQEWTFLIPTSGPQAGENHWFGTLPVSFAFDGDRMGEYGRWETYVAGPKTVIPWLDDRKIADGDLDALTPNRFHAAGQSRRLLTPLQGG